MQAVNALVTSLDCLCSFQNVPLLATNNLTSSMNVAFLDCDDLKVSVGLPILEAPYKILKGCSMELLHVGIVPDHYVALFEIIMMSFVTFMMFTKWSISKTA
jgi:hypothetical protein